MRDARPEPARGLLLTLAMGYAVLSGGLATNAVLVQLRDELHLSGTVTGLHGAMFGIGLLLMGLRGTWLLGRRSDAALFAIAGTGAAAGVVTFTAGRHVGVTLAGAALIGASASVMVLVIPTVVSRTYGADAGIVFSRLNAFPAMLGIMTGPLLGLCIRTGVGWRIPVLVLAGSAAAVAITLSRRTLDRTIHRDAPTRPAAPTRPVHEQGKREAAARNLLAVLVEFPFAVFAAPALHELVGLSTSTSTMCASAFAVGIAGSRALTGRLVLLLGRLLEPTCYLLGATGVVLFLLPLPSPLRVLTLTWVGFGLGPLYTLGTDRMFRQSGGDPSAGSLGALVSGIAIVGGPLLVGPIADRVGWTTAIALFPTLSTIGLVWTLRSRLPRLGMG